MLAVLTGFSMPRFANQVFVVFIKCIKNGCLAVCQLWFCTFPHVFVSGILSAMCILIIFGFLSVSYQACLHIHKVLEAQRYK